MTNRTESAVEINGLVRRYGRTIALEDIHLTVPVGSVTGLLGANGAGKSTLIQCALGLIRADAGVCRVLGEPAESLSAAAKARIGYVPQEIALQPWMSARRLVKYVAAFYPRWNWDLTDRLFVEWDVPPGQKIGKMSVGTRQKLAIILALAHEPSLLILDEPAASLDPAARREFLRAVLAVAAEGDRTVLFSTHITSDLERVADRVAILRQGRLVYDGELDALKDSVKRLHVSSADPLPPDLAFPGAVQVHVQGNRATVSVRKVSEQSIERWSREHRAGVVVEDLNLEDIFVEVQHAGR